MDGIHDLGGMDNFGPVIREDKEPVFHQEWERVVFSHVLALVGAGHFSIDEIRRSTEQIAPAHYLTSSYYEKWLESIINLLNEKGVVTPPELEAGKSLQMQGAGLPAMPREAAEFITRNPVSALQTVEHAPQFSPGDYIVTKNMHPAHHTRIPRYARGKNGRIEKSNGAFLLPDQNAYGGPATAEFNYNVRFSARELWGEDASARDCLFIDLFESYMETQ
jgi:nitrile hydratase subunit beta